MYDVKKYTKISKEIEHSLQTNISRRYRFRFHTEFDRTNGNYNTWVQNVLYSTPREIRRICRKRLARAENGNLLIISSPARDNGA